MPPDQGVPSENLRELLSGVDPEQLRQVLPPLVDGGVITMMFTDIVDSARVKHEVGDEVYFAALKQHDSTVRDCVAKHTRHELNTNGDSFFVAFTLPAEAMQCACRIQQALKETPIIVGDGPIKVRIGLHTGTPKVFRHKVSGRTDLSGTDVDKAARVGSVARGGQVLISERTRGFADRMAVHDWGLWVLKGLPGGQRIFEVLYPGKEAEEPAGHMQRNPIRFSTTFIGRKREARELTELLKEHRLVTVAGMTGIGKARLADFAARRISDIFADGVSFIQLAGLDNSERAVVSALAVAVPVNAGAFRDEAEALLKTLQSQQKLIVLDNFEAVLSAKNLVVKLLLGCPEVHFLVTSQVPLNIDGELLFRPPPMDVPAAAAAANSLARLDAFALFRERARARVHNWDARSPADIAAVAEILRLVDGVPLWIEEVASLVDIKSLPEIENELVKKPLDLLKHRGTAAISRHQSVPDSLDYSFHMLPNDARDIFPKLGVFAGGFFVEDVEAVCDVPDAGELLISLCDWNFVVRQEVLGRSQFSILRTVQKYALSKPPDPIAPAAETRSCPT